MSDARGGASGRAVRAPGRSRGSVVVIAVVAAIVAAGTTPSSAAASPSPDPCALVETSEIGEILGYPVEPPDATSHAAGICFYSSRAISQDGSVTYAVVTPENLVARRSFAAAQARRCAGVATHAPNELICKSYADVANAADLDSYFRARTSAADAAAVPSLGTGAIAAPNALYVRTRDGIVEVVVRRGETLDVDREITLAKRLLDRLAR